VVSAVYFDKTGVLQYFCSALQCVAVRCSALQYVVYLDETGRQQIDQNIIHLLFLDRGDLIQLEYHAVVIVDVYILKSQLATKLTSYNAYGTYSV